ncbi:extracellular solute-binding protein [Lichenicola cladoniae]|uniref:Extracellular solute-binding protein n=1 Tax=Lichenicola cladoniae TaxID=1484109 RepID=A0A6M8HS36_9PROT|nr:extracellular solute-binding protein [Lichenicola cladoniae]NPD65669.1 extracellular solute-binding protein [Acetobacteraceae bacterium]QKE91303.1 extracellular solute-binding protein [Lichenicola cladoniae]
MTNDRDTTFLSPTRRQVLAASLAGLAAPILGWTPASAAAPIRLTMWSWVPDLRTELDMFEAAHPDIRIDVINAGQSAPEYAKLRTALKAGTGAPDIVQLELSMVATFMQVKGLADLAPLGAASLGNTYVDWSWKQVTRDTGVFALPWDSGPMGQIYRQDIAEKQKFTIPKSWDEFAETAIRIRKDGGEGYLCNATFSDGGWSTGLLWQAGWRPFAIDDDKITIRINDDVARRFARYWQKLIDAKAVDTAPGFVTDWYQSVARGRYAIWLTAAWGPLFLSQFAQSSSGQWRCAQLPQWDTAKPSNGNYGGSSLAVSSTSPNKQAAATAIQWLLAQKQPGTAFATKQFLFPVQKALLDDTKFLSTPHPFYGNQPINTVFAEAAQRVGAGFQWSPFNDYFMSQMSNELGAAASGGGTLEAAFDRLQDRIAHYAKQQGFRVSS